MRRKDLQDLHLIILRAPNHWRTSKDDEIKILEVLAAHVKSEGALLKTTGLLLAAVREGLRRKNCTNSDMDETLQQLEKQYKKAVRQGNVPSKEDDLQIYELLEAVSGKKEKKAAAASGGWNPRKIAVTGIRMMITSLILQRRTIIV
jgi:hypothetical protein